MNLKGRNLESELQFRTSRSGGKGGQNVNKTETRVELIFDLLHSNALSDAEKDKIQKRWKNRINAEGEFSICSSAERSQLGNKKKVIDKFFSMLDKALEPEKARIATKMPKAIKEQIRQGKKLLSEKKGTRRMKTRDFL